MSLGLSSFLPGVVYAAAILALLASVFHRKEIGLYFIVALIPMQNLMEKLHAFPLGKDIVDVFIVTLLLLSLSKSDTREDQKSGVWVPTRPILS